MKHYKDAPKIPIGESDIGVLTVVTVEKPMFLKFGGDGLYEAYIIDEDTELGDHYKEVMRIKPSEEWLSSALVKIYDDYELTFSSNASEIVIYRAGEYGCAIRLVGKVYATAHTHLGTDTTRMI